MAVIATLRNVPRPPTPEDLYRLRVATEPRLSPDGRQVAVSVQTVAPGFDGYRHAIWLVPTDGGDARQVTLGLRPEHIGWSVRHVRELLPTERIHGIVTDGGLAPNIVPERAAGRFYARAANARGAIDCPVGIMRAFIGIMPPGAGAGVPIG